jgi:hypothetical protein
MNFSFNSLSLKSINIEQYDHDFELKFKNKIIYLPSIIAELTSPKISDFKKLNATLNNIFIDINISDNTLKDIQSLFLGSQIQLENTTSELFEFLLQLGHFEILHSSLFSPITTNNVFNNICLKQKYQETYSDEIQYLSEHFEEIKNLNIDISINILKEIIENPQLKISNEHSLVEYLLKLISKSKSKSYLIFLKYIKIEFLTQSELEIFIKTIDDEIKISDFIFLWS